ncbi:molybdopterin-synthase adenylyltransferase MoeB [Sinomicrobium pectinilyticum]|uniref:Molybdopterin-synthase adenylyltransferase n=1 Tax=Sinomicrobium pectinilyticum TaxID=1084421 RepID=A0A3N0D2W1_SINP1|nr:HesA/MoeB/ThiF family protein [Sinomicrobium pectinilyticum]RNL69987.1 molybdopterin-synthase adenylyltransferase MoeB [Sinomicrobium pectinilyticum]
MFSTAEKEQYHRQLLLKEIGEEGQSGLKKSRVLVIGAGGLGSAILPYLTAAGIGHIGIIDHDTVDLSNLHRQVLFEVKDVGQNKAAIAAEKLSALNPHIRITPYPTALTKENALELFSSHDIIVDGSDNFPTRYLVNDAAVICGKPVVFGSIFKFEGQVSVFNYEDGPTYRCLFPDPPLPGTSPNCSEIGVLGVLPGIVGTMQANEVIKIICGIGEVLSGKLFTIDCLTMQTQVLRFRKNVFEVPEGLNNVEYACINESGIVSEVTIGDVIKKMPENLVLVDVRTKEEREVSNISTLFPGYADLHIPLNELAQRHPNIPGNKHIIFYCQSGVRSLQAAQWYSGEYPSEVVSSLYGGLNVLSNSIN